MLYIKADEKYVKLVKKINTRPYNQVWSKDACPN